MKRILSIAVAVCALLGGSICFAATTHTVRQGETLSGIGAKYGVSYRAIAKANGIGGNFVIHPRQRLVIPGKAERRERLGRQVPDRSITRSTSAEPELEGKPYARVYRHIMGNPFRGDSRKAIMQHGFSAAEADEIWEKVQNEDGKLITIRNGDILPSVSFGRNQLWTGGVLVAWENMESTLAVQYCTASGRCIIRIVDCLNWALPPIRGQVPVEPPAEAPPEEIPPPPVEKKEKTLWRYDYDAFVGIHANKDTHQHGYSVSGFADAAFYPLVVQTGNGQTEFGIAGKYAGWGGEAEDRYDYDGHKILGGLRVKDIRYDRWDAGLSYYAGVLNEKGGRGDYRQSRSFGVHGPELYLNHYAREMQGKKWFPETQVYAGALLPFSDEVHHTWQGKRIKDVSEIDDLDYVFNAGLTAYLYQGKYVRPYISANYTLEAPRLAEGLGVFAGIQDVKKQFRVGAGVDFNLLNGGAAPGLEASWDIARTAKLGRDHYRTQKAYRSIKNSDQVQSFDPETGMLILK